MLETIKDNIIFLKTYLSKQRKNIFHHKFLSNDYGDSRGTPITRFYIEHFFRKAHDTNPLADGQQFSSYVRHNTIEIADKKIASEHALCF